MRLSAAAPITEKPVSPLPLKAERPEEVMLFAQRAQYVTEAPKVPITEKPVSPLLLKAERPEVYTEEVAEAKPQEQEVMLFAQRAQYVTEAPKAPATRKPVFEHTGAVAASVHASPALFTTNSEGRLVATTGFAQAGGVATELASALSAPAENSRGGDKHDDGSPQYVSAQKSRADIRYERLSEPLLGGIFSVC